MTTERIEKSTHHFWLNMCGVDTYRRSPQHARHDTPWNAFSKGNVLVCTLWLDHIVDVFDPEEDRNRRFVKIGGKMKAWKGPAVAHGEEADRNLRRAAAEQLRVVGYEAEPDHAALEKGDRKVAHFYMDRAHELKRVFEFSSGQMLERLGVEEAFKDVRRADKADEIEPGYLFELVEPKGEFPGKPKTMGAATEEPESDADDEETLFDEVEEEETATEKYALKCIPILIEHVLKQQDDVLQPLTYKQLAERLNRRNKNGVFWARGLGHVLGRVTALIDGLTTEWAEATPYLTTIVVASQGANRGLPGVGIRGKWHDYDKLTRSEKDSKVMAEYQRILDFGSRWNEVLELLGLPAIVPPVPSELATGGRRGGWGGGESEEHKTLKLFVKTNPQLVGADVSWFAADEYALRSGDEVDVFFKSTDLWIGVEVKSSVSDGLDRDYERGLYQVVKYQAVLEAQALLDRPQNPPIVKVFLVLERELPKKYQQIAKSLGIALKENVQPVQSGEKNHVLA